MSYISQKLDFVFYTIRIHDTSSLHILILCSNVEAKDLECLVDQELQIIGSVNPGQSITSVQFTSDILKKNIISVKISESSELAHNYNLVSICVFVLRTIIYIQFAINLRFYFLGSRKFS